MDDERTFTVELAILYVSCVFYRFNISNFAVFLEMKCKKKDISVCLCISISLFPFAPHTFIIIYILPRIAKYVACLTVESPSILSVSFSRVLRQDTWHLS